MISLASKEKFSKALDQALGEKKAPAIYKKYHQAFEPGYWEETSVERIIKDISYLEKISADHFLEVGFYISSEREEDVLHLRLYKWEKFIPLSDMLPILADFDLRVWSERNYSVELNHEFIWISDFVISYQHGREMQLEKVEQLFRDAFIETCSGRFESDGLNKLILGAQLSWREITVLRAYTKYLRQVGFHFTQSYIEDALAHHSAIVKDLMILFNLRYDPQQKMAQKNQMAQLEEKILAALDQISSLDEDLIVRRFLALIKATLRTNYFQLNAQGQFKNYLSFKFLSSAIPELPLPLPLYEIFVYSARFEGIHLRSAKVARGGIRWSDRREDFRREILGLMKAQRVKNAIIVPSGAKGGFVLKALSSIASRELIQKEVVECYQLFIRGLLDITDNLKQGKLTQPGSVVCYDDQDPYLVVAADKGTATFSDLANSISKEYEFWLGDAFASGGVTGYDHKKMGITARGAWESVKRHFRERDVNVEETVITVVGVGDMSGDVFGNGLIYSKRLKLIAAFDHRHIFLDPSPDPDLSYQERLRLFVLPSSSWEDYNPKLISRGGGIYKRSLKSIVITPEVKEMLDIQADRLMPQDLIKAILKAPVDLLWNGGIGTYVKASSESHMDVGDKTNDANRINGEELRCKVVGEGGNLGFTQRGRIEYALNKGLINTDFIDNSAGVDCSDHEVNLKILLDHEVYKGKLADKKRDLLLAQMTSEIATSVLRDNYAQAWAISFLACHAYHDTALYQAYIKDLEATGLLDRQVEFLPDDKTFLERRNMSLGLTRPELAVLLAYTKIYIKNELLKSNVPEESYFARIMDLAFPNTVNETYHRAEQEHVLHREIIATQLSSRVVNEMGIVFVNRLQNETGASVADIIRAYTVAASVFESDEMQQLIESLDFKISANEQYELLTHVRHLINISTRWFLHENRLKGNMVNIIEHYRSGIKALEQLLLHLMTGATQSYLENLTEQFLKAGLSKKVASHIAACRVNYTSLNIIEVATQNHFDLIRAAKMYFSVGERFNLVWFRDHISNDVREGAWNALARLTLRDELDSLQKTLTLIILKISKKEDDIDKLISVWTKKNTSALSRWEKMLGDMRESAAIDYSMFFIVLRELGNILE